jgi:hypothetical protein
MFDLDPVIDEDGRNIVLPLSWTYDYARPTMLPAAAPLQHKTVRAEVNGYEFHRMTGDQATNIASGTWQMISVWKPEGTAEFDGKDILHALFIRADIVEIEAKD